MLLVNPLFFNSYKKFWNIIWWLDAGPPSPANHLREVFYRMGFSDTVIFMVLFSWFSRYYPSTHVMLTCKMFYVQEIVALSGAHTLGRSRPERSGWGKSETKYTVLNHLLLFIWAEDYFYFVEHLLLKFWIVLLNGQNNL